MSLTPSQLCCQRNAARLRSVYADMADDEDAVLYHIVRDLEANAGEDESDPAVLWAALACDPARRARYITEHGSAAYLELAAKAMNEVKA